MIEKRRGRQKTDVKVTFSIPVVWLDRRVAVVGDFNGWDATATPMSKRGDVRTATVTLQAGGRYRFRYVDELGRWHDDPAADDVEASGLGSTDCILDLSGGQDDVGSAPNSRVRTAVAPGARAARRRPEAVRPSRRGDEARDLRRRRND